MIKLIAIISTVFFLSGTFLVSAYGDDYNNSRSVCVSGNLAFVADYFDGLEIINITNC